MKLGEIMKKYLLFLILAILLKGACGEEFHDYKVVDSKYTDEPIEWVHDLPSSCTKITYIKISIKAYDVDYNNKVPVFLNGVFVGYLEGDHNEEWATTTFTVTDPQKLKLINDVSTTQLHVYVSALSSDWVKVATSDLTIQYSTEPISDNSLEYKETMEDIYPKAVKYPTVWTHTLPEDYINISSITISIEALDVDKDNYIKVYANGVFIGYLDGGYNDAWSWTTITITDKSLLNRITNNNVAKTLTIAVIPQKDDWVGIGDSKLKVKYFPGFNSYSTYVTSEDDISGSTPRTITWEFSLPKDTSRIMAMKFTIIAFDVDKPNYIPIYANDVFLGYLEGNHNEENAVTVFYIDDKNEIDKIIGGSTNITMRVEPKLDDWVGIPHADLTIYFEGVKIPPQPQKPMKTPISTIMVVAVFIITLIIVIKWKLIKLKPITKK